MSKNSPVKMTDVLHIDAQPTIHVPQTLEDGSALTMDCFCEALSLWNRKTPQSRKALEIFESIYIIKGSYGELKIESPLYKDKVVGWLGNDLTLYQQVLKQGIVSIFNRYTREEAVFNPLRAKRPTTKSGVKDIDYIEQVTKESSKECDFCRYKTYMARDLSGRLESELAVAAANTFRYVRKHQLIMPRSHHPLNWSYEEFMAMFQLAHRWFDQEHSEERNHCYPAIMWDLLPHAGASQIHPHLQIVLVPHRYPGVIENWVIAAREYHTEFRRNYFTDLILVHDSLGLTVRYKSAVAIATLVPKKDNEVIIICKKASTDFYTLLYYVIKAFVEDKELYPFTMTATLPPLKDNTESIPAFIRIVTRGRASEIRSDISALELFTFYNANSDPFTLVKEIQNSVDKRSRVTEEAIVGSV